MYTPPSKTISSNKNSQITISDCLTTIWAGHPHGHHTRKKGANKQIEANVMSPGKEEHKSAYKGYPKNISHPSVSSVDNLIQNHPLG